MFSIATSTLKRRYFELGLPEIAATIEYISDDESDSDIPLAKRRCLKSSLKSRKNLRIIRTTMLKQEPTPSPSPPTLDYKRPVSPVSPVFSTLTPRVKKATPTESIDSRRLRRERLVRALTDLTVRVRNGGFTFKQFDCEIGRIGDITKYLKNDENGTMHAAAQRHGIVFFLDRQTEMYYVDDLHAQAWGIPVKPKNLNLVVSSGSKRGLKVVLRKKGGYRISRFAIKAGVIVKADRQVMDFCKTL